MEQLNQVWELWRTALFPQDSPEGFTVDSVESFLQIDKDDVEVFILLNAFLWDDFFSDTTDESILCDAS